MVRFFKYFEKLKKKIEEKKLKNNNYFTLIYPFQLFVLYTNYLNVMAVQHSSYAYIDLGDQHLVLSLIYTNIMHYNVFPMQFLTYPIQNRYCPIIQFVQMLMQKWNYFYYYHYHYYYHVSVYRFFVVLLPIHLNDMEHCQ